MTQTVRRSEVFGNANSKGFLNNFATYYEQHYLNNLLPKRKNLFFIKLLKIQIKNPLKSALPKASVSSAFHLFYNTLRIWAEGMLMFSLYFATVLRAILYPF